MSKQALSFYASYGLGEIVDLRRYEGTPLAQRAGEAWNPKVLHSEFSGAGVRFCASDGLDSEPMKGCALLLERDDVAGARAIFDALSVAGRVTVSFAQQFWGWYGNFTDRFGVQWAALVRPSA